MRSQMVWRSPLEATEDRNSTECVAVVERSLAWRSPSEATEDRNTAGQGWHSWQIRGGGRLPRRPRIATSIASEEHS
ncbi:hypothetical protein Misp03_59640 [Microbispora sp. NBRC 16548]|nr:hypothetical protein Misp03_59640 [Microbispora sp. NBRC 16548]